MLQVFPLGFLFDDYGCKETSFFFFLNDTMLFYGVIAILSLVSLLFLNLEEICGTNKNIQIFSKAT